MEEKVTVYAIECGGRTSELHVGAHDLAIAEDLDALLGRGAGRQLEIELLCQIRRHAPHLQQPVRGEPRRTGTTQQDVQQNSKRGGEDPWGSLGMSFSSTGCSRNPNFTLSRCVIFPCARHDLCDRKQQQHRTLRCIHYSYSSRAG